MYQKFLTHFNQNQLSLSKLWLQFQEAFDQSCRPHPFHACVSCVHFTSSCASWVTLVSPADLLLKVQWSCVSHHLTMAYTTPPPRQSSPGFRSLLSNLPPDSSAVFDFLPLRSLFPSSGASSRRLVQFLLPCETVNSLRGDNGVITTVMSGRAEECSPGRRKATAPWWPRRN